MGNIYGYVRVSTKEQNEDRQLIALQEAGVPQKNIYMGLFSKKDADGFPKKYIDMWGECCDTPSLKIIKEEDIFPCLQKMFTVGVTALENNKMGDVYSDISIGRFVACAVRLANVYDGYGDLSTGKIIWWTQQAAYGYAAGYVDGTKDQKKTRALLYRAFDMYNALNSNRGKESIICYSMAYPFDVDMGIPEMLEGKYSTPAVRQLLE